jgi:outer membrane protein assembly factor BamB
MSLIEKPHSRNKYFLSFFIILFFISSCSSISSLKFWDKNEIDIDEPRPLEAIIIDKKINIQWDSSFSGNNSLGNFIPGFTSNSIFFADNNGNVRSIDPISGNAKWEKKLSTLSSGVASGFGIVVVADIDGNVIALNQDDGSMLWKENVKGEVLSPAAIDTKFVIVKTGSGELLALDKINGQLLWSYRSKLPSLTIRGSSSPVIDGDLVFSTFDNGRLGVFELNSGFPLWDGAISYTKGSSELENIIDSDSNPVIDGGYVYTTNYQGNLNLFDIAQKRSVWQSPTSSFYSPLLTRGLIVLVESDSLLRSFFTKTLKESWISEEYRNRNLSNPVSFSGYVVVGDFEGYIHIIDALNGRTVSRKKISKKPIKKIVSRSKSFYVIDEAFNLYSLSI